MGFVRIKKVVSLENFCLRLTLTNGTVVERDVSHLLVGAIFEPIRNNPKFFNEAHVEAGTVVWPNKADICPDVLIWGGAPPMDSMSLPPEKLSLQISATEK